MTPEGYQLVCAVFDAVLRCEPGGREALLAEACKDDRELRAEVERLLAADADARHESFLDVPTAFVPAPPPRPITEGPGDRVGPYKILQPLGEGGMGAVFLAEQGEPVRRRVALKLIKPGMDSAQVIARFAAERQALALMDHPNIARVLDAGTTDGGRPYFIMELVKGVPITDYCDQNRLTTRQRLELLIPVCRAIQHAHQKGIIHRDIKPSNILVTLVDGEPVAKVIDFGVAKAIDQRLTEQTICTQTGAALGTLEYMSPEQAESSALDVDTRSDVYSLGALLYELLTGTTPLERARLREAGYLEIVRRIKEEEPPKPSTRLSGSGERLPSIAARRGIEPARLSKLVRGELDWIAMKALEKDRTRRYETANGLARDIERYLGGEAVEAGRPSTRYRLSKFARRHRVALATAAAFALLLAAGAAVSTGLAIGYWRAERRANRELEAAEASRSLADRRLEQTLKAHGYLFQIIGETFLNHPEARRPLVRFLDKPRVFFEDLTKDLASSQDVRSRRLLANGLLELARIDTLLDRAQDARRELDEATALYGSLGVEPLEFPDYREGLALAHNNLGAAFGRSGDRAAAADEIRKALKGYEALAAAHPDARDYIHGVAVAHLNLAGALGGSGDRAGAADEVRKALKGFAALAAAHPKFSEYREGEVAAHDLLAEILHEPSKPDEAIAPFRGRVRPDPAKAIAHYNRGMELRAQGNAEEAIDELDQAVGFDGDRLGDAIFELAELLGRLGRYDQAIEKLRRARELSHAEWRPEKVQLAKELIERFTRRRVLAARLPGVIRGDEKPRDADEELAFAEVAVQTKRFDAAARLFASSFRSDPKLAEDMMAQNRYNAACAAALAAAGKGDDEPPMIETERARWRTQALDWLVADLADWTRLARTGPPQARATVKPTLGHWKADVDLAAIRDAGPLKALSEGDREACRSLWARVDALLETAGPR